MPLDELSKKREAYYNFDVHIEGVLVGGDKVWWTVIHSEKYDVEELAGILERCAEVLRDSNIKTEVIDDVPNTS